MRKNIYLKTTMQKNRPELTIFDKIIVYSRKWKKALSELNTLGKTQISLMLIPHNNEKIIKLDLSIYLILFLSIISIMLVSLTIGNLGVNLLKKNSTTTILERGNQQRIIFLHHEDKAAELEEILGDLESEVENLNTVTWGKYFKENRIPSIEVFKQSGLVTFFGEKDEMQSNLKIFRETVERFTFLHQNLNELKPVFLNSSDYLETRESIVQSMPRGRPLGPGVGFIASTYGRREDPVYGGGEFHNGVDFAAPMRTPIYATAPGVVADANFSETNLGNHLRINHENGFFTLYAHCSELKVKKGDIIKRGDLIALVGSTGKSTGSHLHYEVHIGM
ncbi:MAG: M23 family metallopeptidase, partial [Spirochaetia bacterium]|nr:M23 family metallopeptidase [Spirochaetia bacterium]